MKIRIIYNNKTNKIHEIIKSDVLEDKEEISIYQNEISDDKLNSFEIIGMKNNEPIFKEKEKNKTSTEKIQELENKLLLEKENQLGGII